VKFDRAFYRHFYLDLKTAVASRAEMDAHGRLIAAFAPYAAVRMKRILDPGAGLWVGRGAPATLWSLEFRPDR
jgi:hypothetical protein